MNVLFETNLVRLDPTTEKQSKNNDVQETMEISNNNIVFDGSTTEREEVPVHYIHHVSQIYPIGAICKLAMILTREN